MNLKLIHRVIDSYNETLDESDKARLAFFEGLWEEMDRWSSGPTAAAKGYGLPSQEAILDAWNSDQAILRIAPAQLNKDRFVAIFKALCTYVASANISLLCTMRIIVSFPWGVNLESFILPSII